MAAEPRIRFLTSEEVNTIYENSLKVLAKKGVKITHQQGLTLLDRGGAEVDFGNQRVRFPKDIVEYALETVPNGCVLAGGDERYDTVLPHPKKMFYSGLFSGNQIYIDPDTNMQRNVSLNDVEELGQLVQVLDHIDLCSYPFPTDIPGETADVHALKVILENTLKPVRVHPYSLESLEYLFELARVIGGGAEKLKKKPRVSMICCALTPLVFKDMDIEAIIQCCRSGVPVHACSLATGGGTAPVTIAGRVLLMGVEILAMVVISQLIEPGTPVFAAPLSLEVDLGTGELLKSSVEASLGAAAIVQFVKEAFRIPTDTVGFGSDSHFTDGQAMAESAFTGSVIALTGCADIISEAGGVDSILGYSPVKLIIDNTQASILKRTCKGITVDEDALALKEILNVPPNGSFMEIPHTLQHCREALRPKLLIRRSTKDWIEDGTKGLYEKALAEYRELKESLKPLELPEEILKEMNSIAKRADKCLIK